MSKADFPTPGKAHPDDEPNKNGFFKNLRNEPFWINKFEEGEAISLTCEDGMNGKNGSKVFLVVCTWTTKGVGTKRGRGTVTFPKESQYSNYFNQQSLTHIAFAQELFECSVKVFGLPDWARELPGKFVANNKKSEMPPKGHYDPAHLRKHSPVDAFLARPETKQIQRTTDYNYIDFLVECKKTEERGYFAPQQSAKPSKAKPWVINGDILSGVLEEEEDIPFKAKVQPLLPLGGTPFTALLSQMKPHPLQQSYWDQLDKQLEAYAPAKYWDVANLTAHIPSILDRAETLFDPLGA